MGGALGLATLLQVFPALLPVGLFAWALLRRARGERLPGWLPGLVTAFLVTVVAGVAASAVVVGPGAWSEFFAKILLHGQMLSLYRIGLKPLVTLDHFLVPAPDYDYAAALRSLAARSALHAAGAATLGLALVPLARRVGALLFATTALAVVLTILTPVHYYFAVLVLLLLVGPEQARSPAATLSWTALLAWSAAGYAALLATDSRAFANSAILSAGLFVALILHCLGWRSAARRATP